MKATYYKGEDFTVTFSSTESLAGFTTKAVKFFTPLSAIKTATITAIDSHSFSAKFSATDTADLTVGSLNIVLELSNANGKMISKTVQATFADPYLNGGERESTDLTADIVFLQNQEISINFAVTAPDIINAANEAIAAANTATTNANNATASVNAAVLSAGDLGAIAHNASAPTPARNGHYRFSSAGICSWIAGTPTVKAGDLVAVTYTAPSTYAYVWISILNGGINDLSTGGAAYWLSAEMGKVLSNEKTNAFKHIAPFDGSFEKVNDLSAEGWVGAYGNYDLSLISDSYLGTKCLKVKKNIVNAASIGAYHDLGTLKRNTTYAVTFMCKVVGIPNSNIRTGVRINGTDNINGGTYTNFTDSTSYGSTWARHTVSFTTPDVELTGKHTINFGGQPNATLAEIDAYFQFDNIVLFEVDSTVTSIFQKWYNQSEIDAIVNSLNSTIAGKEAAGVAASLINTLKGGSTKTLKQVEDIASAAMPTSNIVNDNTTGGTDKALSAEFAKNHIYKKFKMSPQGVVSWWKVASIALLTSGGRYLGLSAAVSGYQMTGTLFVLSNGISIDAYFLGKKQPVAKFITKKVTSGSDVTLNIYIKLDAYNRVNFAPTSVQGNASGVEYITFPDTVETTDPAGAEQEFIYDYHKDDIDALLSNKETAGVAASLINTLKGGSTKTLKQIEDIASAANIPELVMPIDYSTGLTDTQKLSTDIMHIIGYGQSNDVGEQTYPPLTTDPVSSNIMMGDHVMWGISGVDYTVVNPLISTSRIYYGTATEPWDASKPVVSEHIGTSLANILRDKFSVVSNLNRNFLLTSCGMGGQTIEQLGKPANGNYNRIIAACNQAKAYATAQGKTISCPIVHFNQGEANYRVEGGSTNDKDAYKALLKQLISDISADIMSIYGQSYPPIFVIHQVCTQYAAHPNHDLNPGTAATTKLNSTKMSLSMAQLEVCNEVGNAVMACSQYMHWPSGRGGHMDPNSHRWNGEQTAKAIHKSIFTGNKFKPLQPETLSTESNKVYIDFHVPCMPLRLDDKTLPNGNGKYGFEVSDGNGARTISTVQVQGSRVILTCDQALSGSVSVAYANDPSVDFTKYGNLRDSDKSVSKYIWQNHSYLLGFIPKKSDGTTPITGEKYPLWNWCVKFYYELTAGSTINIEL